MSRNRSARVVLLAAAAASSTLLLAAGPASASSPQMLAHHHPTARQHPNAHPAPHPKGQHFAAQGLVVSASGSAVVVLAHTVTDRGGIRHNTLITVAVGAKHPHAPRAAVAGPASPALVVGDRVDLSGVETGSGVSATFTATQVVQHPQPAQLFLGTVTAVSATLITVTTAVTGSDGGGDTGDGSATFTADVTNAAVTVDGAPGTLTVGQSVAILGEGTHDTVLAATVAAFTTAPAVLAGDISDVTGTVVTIGDGDNPASVDLTGVPLVVNGNPGAAVTDLGVDARIIVLGSTDTTGAFTATLAFGFNNADTNPAGDNPDN